MNNHDIQAIINAWILKDFKSAIALTNKFAIVFKEKYCLECGKRLAPQARGLYCKQHRYQSKKQRERVKKAKEKND